MTNNKHVKWLPFYIVVAGNHDYVHKPFIDSSILTLPLKLHKITDSYP